MDKQNYYKQLVKSRKEILSKDEKEELADREVKTIFFLLKNFFSFDKKYFQKKIKVLDLGCGDKFIKNPLENNNCEYKGYDIEDLDLEKDSLPDSEETVDMIVSLGLIEALKNPSNLIKESYRVLKKGGYLYIITPNWKKDYKNFFNNYYHKTPFTPESLETALTLNNFENVKTFPGLRCKPKWYYSGPLRFEKAFYLLPFSGNNFLNYNQKKISRSWIPEFLKGHSRSIIAIAQK